MLGSGALGLVLVAGSGWIPALGWRNTYVLMPVLMAIEIVAVFWGEEPSTAPAAPRTLRDAVIEPLREFFSRPRAGWILVLLVLYKLGDAFAGSLTTAFLLRGAGFSLEDVGYVNKAVGLAATIVGVLFGGALMVRLGLYRALLGFGILQAGAREGQVWGAFLGRKAPAARNVTHFVATSMHTTRLWRSGQFPLRRKTCRTSRNPELREALSL